MHDSHLLASHRDSIAVISALAEHFDTLAAIASRLLGCLQNGGTIYLCGNGGSAADAQHVAAEFVGRFLRERRALPAVALTCNTSILTAIGNDYSFDELFVRQLENHAERGDLLILSSVSGSSPNLHAAIRWAREHGLVTIALVGGKRGTVAEHADHLIVVDDVHYGRVEDVQMNILHMLCYAFMELKDG